LSEALTMKIKAVTVLRFARKLDGKAWNPVFRWHERQAPLLVIETQDGERGIGEAWSRYSDVETVLEILANHVAPALIGQDIEHPLNASARILIPDVANRSEWALAAALSAVDIALWDAYGHEECAPIWRLLGGSDGSAPVYASGGLYRDEYTEEDLANEVRGYIARGFNAVKIKVAGVSKQKDLCRLRAVRNVLNESNVLWVDAVNQLTVDSVISWAGLLAPFNVSAIQSPLPFWDVDGLSKINRNVMSVIAAESEFRTQIFQELLDKRAVTHLQYCLSLCGGFSGAVHLDGMAIQHGVTSTPQCFSTAIAQAATLHFAAARSNVVSAEYHCYHDHLSALYRDGVGVVVDGHASAGDWPGLGVCIPEVGAQADGSVISIYSDLSL